MADNTIHIADIGALLEKFFHGETSCAEEKALEDFFISGAPIPAGYECYRDMFAWYASGMDPDKLPEENKPTAGIRLRRWKALAWWCSSAAIIAIAAAIGWGYSPKPQQAALYAETFVTRDGKIIEGETEISAEIDASLISGYCLEQEINALMGLNAEK